MNNTLITEIEEIKEYCPQDGIKVYANDHMYHVKKFGYGEEVIIPKDIEDILLDDIIADDYSNGYWFLTM